MISVIKVGYNSSLVGARSSVFGVQMITKIFGICIIWVNIFDRTGYDHVTYAFFAFLKSIFELEPSNLVCNEVNIRTLDISSGFAKFQYLYFSDISIYFLITRVLTHDCLGSRWYSVYTYNFGHVHNGQSCDLHMIGLSEANFG